MANSSIPGARRILEPSDERPSGLRWLILFMAAAAAACAMVSTISFAPIIGSVAQTFGLDLGSASLLFIGIPTSVMAIGMTLFGFLVDRFGVFRIVIASLAGLITTYVALAMLGHGLAAVLVIRAVQGLCSAGLMVSITPTIAGWFPSNEIGRAMGFPSIGAGIGTIIGLNTGPQLMHWVGDWQRGTAMLAIIAAVTLVVAVTAAKLAQARVPAPMSRLPTPIVIADTRWPQTIAVLRLPLFRIGLLLISLACWINMSFADLTPGFLAVNPPVGAGYGAQQAGGLMSLFTISSVIAAPIAGFLMDTVFRRQNRTLVLLGFLISATMYPAVLLSSFHLNRLEIVVILLLGGVSNPFVNVTLMTMAAKIFDLATVGRICGLWMSISFFAGAVGVLTGALILGVSHDYRVPISVIGVMSLVGALVALLLPKRPLTDELSLRLPDCNDDRRGVRSLSHRATVSEAL